ncbi:bacterial Ig-like domain protein [Methanobrevibacter cuticularis]|uniref:Bacterial Ig-like domain protein n=2 Tax=Methanobrevibacter cuticularis TaxID=47311 RepID=A0A166CGK2_9EURY|nr:bacterial Ig-like domain protein [Methanobrevibacter cuticularis]
MISKINNLIENDFLSMEANIPLFNRVRLRNAVLITFLFLCFFALLSGASAANFNSSSNNQDIQAFLSNTSAGDNELVFEGGTYNQITSLNVSRSVNISSAGQVNMVGTGRLFNITAPNVKIVNLNMSGYNTAINSNRGNLSVIGCNMSTIDISVNLSGASLTGVLLENNTIISSVSNYNYGAVYVNATTGSVVNIAVKGNNIRCNGTSSSDGVRFNVVNCNNALMFENNNITGTSSGVWLIAETSKNNITIINNNITGTGGYGVYLRAYTNSNNNISIANNNITGGPSANGVRLSAYTSNNNITIANNNITGTSGHGVALDAYTSNNNISIANNNITGTSYGVELRAYTSNNNITFTDNNIRSPSGMYVNCYNRGFSGLSVVNNTINATSAYGSGIGFASLNSVDLSDIFVSGNNIFAGTAYGINFADGLNSVNNVTINYNRVLAVIGLNIPTMTSGIDANLNWWGVNDITGKIRGINTSNHYILNITNSSSLNNVHIGDKVRFSLLVLNTTLSNTGVENLPDFVIDGTFNGVAYNSSRGDNFTYMFTVLSLGIQTLDASLDEEYMNITFYAIKNSTNSTIVVSPNPVSIGENITVSGVLANFTGITSVNVTVDGNFFTNVAVDGSGYWELNYTTNRIGTDLEVIVSFVGNDNYTSFSNVANFNVTKANATINISLPNNATYGENSTINGNITDVNGSLINGTYNITVTINGMDYNVTVVDGLWSLTIPNRNAGIANVNIFFSGNSNYNNATIATNYAVNPKNLGTTITITSTKNGNKITYKITLKDSEGNILANQTVTLAIAGKTVSLKTNGAGVVQYTFTAAKAGKYQATATYNGLRTTNIIYNKSTKKSSTVEVKASKIKIAKIQGNSVKKRSYKLYYKVYTIKNYGDLTGSRNFKKYFKLQLKSTAKKGLVYLNYNKKAKLLKIFVKNLKAGKIVKVKLTFYKPTRR